MGIGFISGQFLDRRATLDITNTKKTVHNSDIKSLAKDLKGIKNEINEKFLAKSKGPSRGIVRTPSEVGRMIESFIKRVASMKKALASTTYTHNPGKLEKLNELEGDARKFGKVAIGAENFLRSSAEDAEKSKVITYAQKMERAKSPGEY
ncbi:hypothetical protein WK55_16555 [Burkholderia ubonensis]|uniref:hypothetical protein n=1 Tax=Burkholderia ubonensis TaxID=101571 RepID=UPI0007551ED3|nr:hypothetical protein [Burkholderia ubonensis]KVT57789.1 hypothetical protein WK55_16555 [Burkholderia ubonensis]